jgi:hypothetical protein
VWQVLRETIYPQGCEIVTVAQDVTGGRRAKTFIERAEPRHPALIDQAHVMARLFGVVNIPSSIWIDESGIIVRPAEHSPRPPGERSEPRPLPEGIPQRLVDIAEESAKITDDAAAYHLALADWVANGAKSRYALSPDEVVARSRPRDVGIAMGHAHFELATRLESLGDHDGAIRHFREAHRLAPDNWTFRRQAWALEPGPNRFWQGPIPDDPQAWPYEGDWLADVRRQGPETYYESFNP